jgi:hypothetical protein
VIALFSALLFQDGQMGSRLGEVRVGGQLTECSLSFDVQRLGGLVSVVLEDGMETPIVELHFFPDVDKPAALPVSAVLLYGGGNNDADQRPPRFDVAGGGSFSFKMGDRTTSAVADMIRSRTLRFSYALAGGTGSEATVSLSRYEAAQIGDCLTRLTPGATYLR